jgi:hypothetical protein
MSTRRALAITILTQSTDEMDRRAAEIMRSDPAISQAGAQMLAHRQLCEEQTAAWIAQEES